MQIVIDIPEDEYQNILLTGKANFCVVNAIEAGTPLPKGHGRLIDADEIISEATKGMKYPANHEYMECVIAHMKLAPTIIEADKENTNE